MPNYRYTALAENGSQVAGESAASSIEELRQELAAQGLLVQRIDEQRRLLGLKRARRIGPEDFLLFNQEFTALLRAGLTVPEALRLSADRPEQPALAGVLKRVEEDVRRGAQTSEACARHPDVFDNLYIATLKTGEKTGNLPAVLNKYQETLRHRVAMQKKVSQALAYPLFLLVTLGVILAVLFAFVLPRFVAIYTDFGAQLPLATRVLIAIVHYFPIILPGLIGLGAFGWYGRRRYLATEEGRLRVDRFKERLPFFGEIYRQAAVAQITRTLSALLSGGVSLVEAMRITQDSLTNRARARQLAEAATQVTQGRSLAQAMRATALVPGNAIKMIEVGEASGGLDNMLGEIALFYEESLAHTLARLMALIEPVLMLLMGIFVGGTIIVMYLPIFYIVDVIK